MLPILIVDDEPSIAQLIAMTLEPLGQPLIIAYDGERAADLLETQKFDLVILDVMLPGVDGFALMDYIAPTGTPVVFLTAKNAVADRVRGLKLGAYDYIVKPFCSAGTAGPGGGAFAPYRPPRGHAERVRRGHRPRRPHRDPARPAGGADPRGSLTFCWPSSAPRGRRFTARRFTSGSGALTPSRRPAPSTCTSTACAKTKLGR